MPIYEFSCEACGNEFEHIQAFSDNKIPHCPRCQSGQVMRKLGRPAIHFKGSGWYITDSKKSAERSSASGNGDGKGVESKNGESNSSESKSGEKGSDSKVEKASSGGEGKTESKTESKSADKPAPAAASSTGE
jgi:putative FmdB family regulatory protein